ncbi:ABC transporter ATP-binding protein [Fundicoccus sp. Sow4_H7]|uniref:ABC transporter ATP-binding protein n=1 Tax=Fundicoccus sp. Sow4_H7 TaxID=3438784 RepID=UPI003F8EA211
MQVRFEDVTMRFQDNTVLDKINFTLPSKQLVSFLGPSGCGKSTTLYLISGLLEATDGHIFFDDKDVTKLDPVKRQVGLVFQNYALYPHLTVMENIMFPLKMAKMPKAERRERAEEMARLTRITDQLNKYPRQLSGGQQQRVAISRALSKSPDIILMDEPLSNLDARLRIEMREEIRRIQQETEVTTVFVTHDQEEALSIADRVMVLDKGEIQQISDPVTLYQRPRNLFVAKFIGSPVINTFARTSAALNQNAAVFQEEWERMGIRSEQFKLADETNYLIKATIQRIENVGKEMTIHCMAADEHFVVTDIDAGFEEGEVIYLDVKGTPLLFDQREQLIESRGGNES